MYADIDKLLKEQERNRLTSENILCRLSEYQLFAYYLGNSFTIGKVFSSPFRTDRTPSFCIYRSGSDTLRFKDFSTGENGGVLDFISQKLCLNFTDVLYQINTDFNLNLDCVKKDVNKINGYIATDKEIKEIPKRYSEIDIKVRNYVQEDLDYWNSFGITLEMLQLYKVFAVDYAYHNEILWYRYYKTNPCYAYLMESIDKTEYSFKLYKPLEIDKRKKWKTNAKAYSCIQGYHRLPQSGKMVVITKSLKDVMVLKTMGISSIAVQAESIGISEELYKELVSRFETIYLLFDFDEGGIKGSERFKQMYPDIKIMFLQNEETKHNGCKDISDARRKIGFEKARNLLTTVIITAI